jgi:excisionase family DNA binding protein|tara:strand:+ start:905 stop:1183 length:279 start_codon:yes stop_codon:yes gene_type:complete
MATVYETETSDTQILVSIQRVAEYLNVSVSTVRNLIRRGQLPYVVVGGIYRFDLEEIKNNLRDNTSENQRNISRRGDLKSKEVVDEEDTVTE